MFLLDKWYLDVVTRDGTAAVCYAARLRWAGFRVHYASRIVAEHSTTHTASTLRDVILPESSGSEVVWANTHLAIHGRWHGDAPSIARTLMSGAAGTVAWQCPMPRARGQLLLDGRQLEGLGYVESLRMTIPPWRLPFSRLRWGRHVSPSHSVIWIEWDDGRAGRWIWLDGREQPDAVVTGHGVTGLAGGLELRLTPEATVRDRRVLAILADHLPRLAHRLADTLHGMHEQKWLARSILTAPGMPDEPGWVLHEVVTW